MATLVVNDREVRSILTMEKCIELVEEAHAQLDIGEADQPLRFGFFPKQSSGLMASMPAYLNSTESNPEIFGLKIVTVFHENDKLGLDSHQGSILLLNPETGILQAIIDGREITAIRTAAASAVATKYLANEDSSILGLIGTGVQAHTHLEAISMVRDIDQVWLWNRTPKKAQRFATQYAKKYDIKIADNPSELGLRSDIICTLTASKDPIIDKTGVKLGAHINAVGSATPSNRELGSELIQYGKLFTDVIESALNEAGDILIPMEEGVLNQNPDITELGRVINDSTNRRDNRDQVTIYKSLGVGIQDIATANYVYQQAKKQNLGTSISI